MSANPALLPTVQTPGQEANAARSADLPPPWAKPAAPGGAGGRDPEKVRQLQALQSRLTSLTAGGKVTDFKALDSVLADLIKVQGSTVIGGVDFAVLRSNLGKAQEIERLAKEMELLSKQPKPDMPKIQALMAQIQATQAGLRTDVMAVQPATSSTQKP
ncbi:hypothetical protein Q9Q94_03480 [Uliginosibacterium sp. 31-16]|uniref:hypothetical protein n=1 Tax=Uliginosibacterium sp. 31-16 TaxID=3068315 RepID=UPI00273EFBE0|nr:hypothetical protein [Uliginosibacterium sp. 31-16]MDP5238573.1 hypothetical protein [Uliginosibacterium sp. 31-16]